MIRKIHRWTSAVFTLIVIVVMVVTFTRGEDAAEWVYLMPLPFLFLLLLTGIYLFVLPYAVRMRKQRAVRSRAD